MSLRQYAYELPNWSMLTISVMLVTISVGSFNNVESHSFPNHDSIGTLAELPLLYIMKAKSLLRQCPCCKMHEVPNWSMLPISSMLGTNSNRFFNNVESHSVPSHDSIGTLAQLPLLYIMKAKSLLRPCPYSNMHTKYQIGRC